MNKLQTFVSAGFNRKSTLSNPHNTVARHIIFNVPMIIVVFLLFLLMWVVESL